jgi:ABC-type sugar transport system permease subunit
VLVFWLVAGVFLLQVAYSLISAFVFSLTSYRLWVFTHHQGHLTDLYRSFQYVDIQFGGAIAIVLFFSICARLVAGDWRRFNLFIRCFEHPLRTALSLTVLGLFPTALRFLIAFIGLPYSLPWRSALLRGNWGLFRQGDFVESTLILVWVLALVFLARRSLRNNAAAR